jgi:hypothetical protein
MRQTHHDARDLWLAFGLAFDVTRVRRAALALLWTFAVVILATAVLVWRAEGDVRAWPGALKLLFSPGEGRSGLLARLALLVGWWIGFGLLCAPVLRSAAVDIARDRSRNERGLLPLCRQAVTAPLLGMALPGLALLAALLWSGLAALPGWAGAALGGLTLPMLVILTAFGAAAGLVALAAAPLMPPTAMVEGRDTFEALSRPMAYVMRAPFRYAGYWLGKLAVLAISALLGGLAFVGAWGLAAGGLWLTGQTALLRTAIAAAQGEFTSDPRGLVFAAVFWATAAVFVSWLMVVGLCADLLMYLLLRYRVDGVPMNHVSFAEEKLSVLPSALDTLAEGRDDTPVEPSEGEDAETESTAKAGA